MRYLGQEYQVQIEQSPLLRKNGFCELVSGVLVMHVPAKLTPAKQRVSAAHALGVWYQTRAAEIFAERTKIYAAQLGVKVQSIRLRDPKTRWGSCGRDGRLMFSWRAVMLPIELLDYLVVHELCHLVHFDHSKAYWKTVEGILPDYKTRRAQMRASEQQVKQAA